MSLQGQVPSYTVHEPVLASTGSVVRSGHLDQNSWRDRSVTSRFRRAFTLSGVSLLTCTPSMICISMRQVMTASKSTQDASNSLSINAPVDADPFPEPSGSPAHRHAMLAEAAFFIAQDRGFAPGHEHDDWIAAERRVVQRLSTDSH